MAKRRQSATPVEPEPLEQARTIAEDQHPDYSGGRVGDGGYDCGCAHDPAGFTPPPGGPTPPPGPLPGPLPGPFPSPLPTPLPLPNPLPTPVPIPIPSFCTAVSGRYRYTVPWHPIPLPSPLPSPAPGPIPPQPAPGPIIPINFLSVVVRVDVDRYYPQDRISIEVTRLFPRVSAHAIAEVVSDRCVGLNRRIIRANIVYRDGTGWLIPGTTITFTANRTFGFSYSEYKLELSGGGITPRTYTLSFESRYFDSVEFEVDRVSNAGTIVTAYDTGSHPNRPATLPDETIALSTVYERSGFEVSMSPGTSVIPTAGAGANGTWSDAEMHDAMVTFWSRFAARPQWAMWVLYAARHDSGRGLGGIMFDDIGDQHRQGTAIFTDSFIQDVPAGDTNPAAWRNRMQFWTAVHEMGHAFNLAHSWQKALSLPGGRDPWIPLANEPEARSFMNYPFSVAGGESSFFSDFRFRFSDDELVFMRHAPRRFVQMGNSDWFDNHGFEQPDALRQTGAWQLEIRPNREENTYRFLEPVVMELKLTNSSSRESAIDEDFLTDGRHVEIFLQRESGDTRRWRPMITRCHERHESRLEPGASIYGAHMISTSTSGWLIDEPGFYKVQAAVDVGTEIVVSNVLRLFVSPPESTAESLVAPDYFTEDVGRAIAFAGAPFLEKANETLRRVVKTCPKNPAARHAEIALSSPKLRHFKTLDADGGRERLAIKTISAKVSAAAKEQLDALLGNANAAAETMGHIRYFEQLRTVAEALEEHGDGDRATKVMSDTIDVMKKRKILPSMIDNAERRLKRRK